MVDSGFPERVDTFLESLTTILKRLTPLRGFVFSSPSVLCVSNEILEEYLEILQRLTDYETAELIVKTIVNSPFVELITHNHFQKIQADPDDNKFVDCAIAAGARFVVTNDRHFDILRQTPFPYVDVIALAEFAELLKRM